MDVYINLRKQGNCNILATCDADILGKTLKEGKIEFHISEEFYKGRRVTFELALKLIEQSAIVNMVGQKIVQKAIERGLVHPEAVLLISGIPHAQIIKL